MVQYKKTPSYHRISEEMKRLILNYHLEQGYSQRQTAKAFNITQPAVNRIVAIAQGRLVTKSRQRKFLSVREQRRIRQLLLIDRIPLSKVLHVLNLDMSYSTLIKLVKTNQVARLQNCRYIPFISAISAAKRVKFARDFKEFTEWNKVIFTDEKCWCLDGTLYRTHVWTKWDDDQPALLKRQMGGGKIHIWLAMTYDGIMSVVRLRRTVSSRDVVYCIERSLLVRYPNLRDGSWYYQQDNAAPHTARRTQECLQRNGFKTFSWPPYSPDLNPVERVWGMLSREVYRGGAQYHTIRDLEQAIEREIGAVDQTSIKNYINAIPNLLTEVIKVRGQAL